MTPTPGARLGPYEIVALLGAGGMGQVYRARDTRLRREVAIKVLSPQLAADPDALARFEREARAIAALSHPNILAIYDVGREEGVSFAVTELLEGETLCARLQTGALPRGTPSIAPCMLPARSRRRTTRTWPIAISSPKTSSSPATARSSCSTSDWPRLRP